MDAAKLLGDSDMATSYLRALTNEAAGNAAQAAYMATRSDASFDPFEDESGADADVSHEALCGEEEGE
jgi:hypothetical protein